LVKLIDLVFKTMVSDEIDDRIYANFHLCLKGLGSYIIPKGVFFKYKEIYKVLFIYCIFFFFLRIFIYCILEGKKFIMSEHSICFL